MVNKMLSKTQLLMLLLVYMTLLTAMMGLIGGAYDVQTANTHAGTFNIISGIKILPLWLDIIFCIIPSSIIALIILSNVLPAINTGS
jgi:hypothetical protein